MVTSHLLSVAVMDSAIYFIIKLFSKDCEPMSEPDLMPNKALYGIIKSFIAFNKLKSIIHRDTLQYKIHLYS